jgi:hypothetical protein
VRRAPFFIFYSEYASVFVKKYKTRRKGKKMKNAEKKFIVDEIGDIAFAMEKGWISPESAAAKLRELQNQLRNELKEAAQK